MVLTASPAMSADMFWKRRNAFVRCELVEGQPITMPPTKRTHGRVESRLVVLLDAHLESLGYGEVVSGEVGYQLSENTVRAADIAVHLHCTGQKDSDSGWETSLPDLVVEVISPNDRWTEVEYKSEQYLAAGVRELWIVDPETRTVSIRGPNDLSFYRRQDILHSQVLPKLSLTVDTVFATRSGRAPTDS